MAYGATAIKENATGNGAASHINRVSEWRIKEQICDIGRRIWERHFCAGNEGNHSYRLSENRVLCTPTGISKSQLKPEDICTVDMEGNQISGKRKRTSEINLHLAIYKTRPEINAVIHSHPPHATAFAVAGVDLPTCIHPEAEVFLGAVKTAKYVTPGDKRLGESILPYVKDSNTILLQSHGVVCFSGDLEQAYYQLEIVDAYARILILAKQVGSIRPLDAPEMKELLELKERFGLKDARVAAGLEKLNCSMDFLTRVGDVATHGKMMSGGAPVPAPQSQSATDQVSDDAVEQLVQTITDQIMAAMT